MVKKEQEEEGDDEETLIGRAEKAASRIEEAINKYEQMEVKSAKRRLSGVSEGGMPAEEKKEMTDKEYAEILINKPFGDVKVETPE